MYILINLVSRIVRGERLEKGSQKNTAQVLSFFALLPLWIFGSAGLMIYLDGISHSFITSHAWCMILSAVVICLTLLLFVGWFARIFVRHTVALVLIGVASWGVTAWYVITRLA